MRGKPLNPLPSLDTLKAAYYHKGSVKKAAKSLHIAQWRVSQALFEAGITDTPGWQPVCVKPTTPHAESKCGDCIRAIATRCAFIAASRDTAEAALIRLAATYITKEQTYRDTAGHMTTVESYIVTDCPQHRTGELVMWDSDGPATGRELAELRYPHGVGRL